MATSLRRFLGAGGRGLKNNFLEFNSVNLTFEVVVMHSFSLLGSLELRLFTSSLACCSGHLRDFFPFSVLHRLVDFLPGTLGGGVEGFSWENFSNNWLKLEHFLGVFFIGQVGVDGFSWIATELFGLGDFFCLRDFLEVVATPVCFMSVR